MTKTGQQEEKKPRRRPKKASAHAAHHGGAWKVAYADFVTAMMALFLVLWLVSQADSKVKSALASYFRDPGVFNTVRGGVLNRGNKMSKEQSSVEDENSLMGAAGMLQQKFEKSVEFRGSKDQIKIDITDEGLRIQILDKADRVSFNSGSAELAQEARAILGEIARGICSLPNPIFVGGHTDRKLFAEGSVYTNWELSTDRANAARRTLEANCVKPEQIRRVIGYADTDLLIPSDPYAPANRRITIIVRRLAGQAAPRPVSIKPDSPKIESGASADPSPSPPDSAAQQANKAKLATEGHVSVGEPDKLPDGTKRTRAQ